MADLDPAERPAALLTLGRLPKAMEIARALSGAGWRVIVAEPSAWHHLRVSRHVAASFAVTAPNDSRDRYLDDLARIVRRERVRLVVPVSEETMHAAFLADRLGPEAALFCADPHSLLRLHDKLAFAENAAARGGLPVPATARADTAAAATLAATGGFVVKPRFTSSGTGLHLLEAGAPLPRLADAAAHLVQRRVVGEHVTSFSIARAGRVIGTVVYRGLLASGTVSVAFERVERPAVTDWVGRFIAGTGHTGFISFDFIVPEGGEPQAIECNPRATSGIHFVDPAALARALLEPDRDGPLALRRETRMMQFWPCMSELGGVWFDGPRRRAALAVMRGCRDVTWDARDPLPALTMPLTAAGILWRAARRKESFGKAATHDIGWFG
jgi:hypothetical protein